MKRSLRSWLWQVPLAQEVEEELAFHVEMRTRELVERGMDPKTAHEAAMSRLGDVTRLTRACIDLGRKRDREMRFTQWLEEFRDDVKFALRQLRRSPGFTLVAVITLALGIGVNGGIFALADATLLRPLPFRQPDRLVMVWERLAGITRGSVAPLNFRDWNERARTFEAMASFLPNARRMTGTDGMVEQIPAQMVSARFFDVLDVKPIAGRTFLPSDATPMPTVVVLSEAFWRTRFGGDRALVGRDIGLDGQSFTVIGIVPASSQLRDQGSLWTLTPTFPGLDGRGLHFMQVIGRLKPGVTLDSARSDMTAIADALAKEYPATNRGRGITIEPLRDWLVGPEVRTTSILLFGVVGFVLLMCCANVANLLLARTTGRARELAVRGALGAGTRRIVAQILTESLVLAAIGGLLGLGIGALILKVTPPLIPAGLLPSAMTLAFDTRVVAFCVMAAFLVGVLFGLVPAWQATGTSFVGVMAGDGRTTTRSGGRFRGVVAAGEVAAAVLLLCGAGLMLRTLLALQSVDTGFGADNALTMRVNPPHGVPGARYPTQDALRRFYEAVEREVRNVSGVRNVGWVSSLPLDGTVIGGMSFEVMGDTPRAPGDRPLSDYQVVSPAYFETLEIPIIQGRGFTDADAGSAVQVCIVDQAFVRVHLQGRHPIGMRIAIRPITIVPAAPVVREIIGVVSQVKARPNDSQDVPHVYVPLAQNSWLSAALVVRPVGGAAERLAPEVRAAIARVDRQLPVTRIRTLDDVAWEATSRYRFRAVLVMTFAGLALTLAMVGVFGVLAYSVQQRMREFGVRVALGASATDVLRLVLTGAARITAIGAAAGLIAAALVSRWIVTLLFGVQPLDAMSFASALALLATTAAVATAVPAWRAAHVDPVVTFRNE